MERNAKRLNKNGGLFYHNEKCTSDEIKISTERAREGKGETELNNANANILYKIKYCALLDST